MSPSTPQACRVQTRDPYAPFNLRILHIRRAANKLGQYFECIGKLHQGEKRLSLHARLVQAVEFICSKLVFLSREKNRRLPYFVNICLDKIRSSGTDKIRSSGTRGYYAPSVQTTKHLDITHQASLGYYTPSSQIPTHQRYYARHGVSKLCFRKERGRSFRGSILQMLNVVLFP